jgi:hypothetical protein
VQSTPQRRTATAQPVSAQRLSPVGWWAFEGSSMPIRRLRLRRLSHYCWSV